ncbi:response regulator [Labilibaculum sp. A4]|uniref:hybrid sensor histidine kinase/response regulator transcription factor n=1 Tax=Labilibaculum euxinus TaxID=2686357 RepID=UPI000F627BC2|nr:hybrid sensor histidine kinase/response regulator transcription factor [Labilibaculum euxinus]MDQ1771089.1 two-component regulator propeller domain-containing protein [Labilibaculum euxinus]MWN76904.1 response regulator [Labilibaculum euxinus]
MRLRKLIFVFFFIYELSFGVFNAVGINEVQFFNLNETYGLSFRETNKACSDDDGFIWISSKMGIVRYSHDDIRTYQLPFETADILTVSLVCEKAGLYSYTNNGQIFKYNKVKDEFELVINISKQLSNNFISIDEMLVDSFGNLWLASTFGLYFYNKESGLKIVGAVEAVQSLVWYDSKQFLYSVNGKIKLFNTIDFSSEVYYSFAKPTNYAVTSLYYDHGLNRLWIGTMADGLFYLKEENGHFNLLGTDSIPNQPILDIERNSESTLLIGIDGQGVWEISGDNGKVINIFKEDVDNSSSLQGNGVYDIFCDKNKRVWVCTYSGGVSYYDQENSNVTKIIHVANNSNSLANDCVNSVFEDRDGNIWFATNNGISYLNVNSNQWKTYYYNNKEHAQVFLSLCQDEKGRIWAGSYSSGVYIIDPKTGMELAHYSQEETNVEFANNFVFNILKDSAGDIWIGGVRGALICYKSDEDRFVSFKNITVNVMREFNSDKLLIGTTNSLILFDKNSGSTESLVEGYLVYDIFLRDNVAWLCTSGDGIIKYNLLTKEREQISVDSGLTTNFVNSIEYLNGFFWIGTEKGICRLNEKDNTVVTFSSLHNLNNVSYNKNSHFRLSSGKLIWGTNKGALIFDPDQIALQKYNGKIFYQELTVAGRSVRESSDIKLESPLDSLQELFLKHYQNTISLELIPIGVTSSGAKFSWKIEGLDKYWSKPGNNRILSYSNLQSGEYTLRVRMYDSSMADIIDERFISLKIIPPYWNTWWFKLLVLIVIGGFSVFMFKYYIYRLKKNHSEEKINFFANTAHDIRTSLTLINGPIEELNKEPDLSAKALHYLFLATDQTHRLLKVVTQLMDFQKVDVRKEKPFLLMSDIVKVVENRVMMFESYAKSKNIAIKFESNVSTFTTAFDEVMIEKVVDNLISNSVKYSFENAPILVKLNCTKSKWILEVKDRGLGISKIAQKQLFKEFYRGENAINSKVIGSGIGLLLVKNYVDLHGGKVICSSQENIGSTFQVVLPIVETDKFNENKSISNKTLINPEYIGKDLNKELLDVIEPSVDSKMKVLIVEDNDYLQEFLKLALASSFQIFLAADGNQAWKVIVKEFPDLVVSDILMPNMNGYELCRKIKSTYETSHIPIILLTALSDKAQQLKGLGLGADDYITKPFDVTLLQQKIRTIIQNREVARDKALKTINLNDECVQIYDNQLNEQFVKQMVEVVRENISNSNFSKNDFASKMNVSPSLLYKKVKSLTNQSPTDFIKSIRLDYSLTLLQSKKYSITEISELSGFATVGYYSTVFRKYYGKSPSQIF